MTPKVSIIIPTKNIDNLTLECIKHCQHLDYPDYEILIITDTAERILDDTGIIKIIPVEDLPGVKKNKGVEYAEGSICAFVDSDAYPDKKWLKNAVRFLQDENTGAVGGPNLTPAADSLLQKLAGLTLSSTIALGKFSSRYKLFRPHYPVELPSCNLIVKKDVLIKTKSFTSDLLTAEDADLSFKIQEIGKKIFYSPDVIVYHHRRPLFMPYFKQIFRYGLDKNLLLLRMPFKKKLRKLCYYIIPGTFSSAFIMFLLSLFFAQFRSIFLILLTVYFLILLIESIRLKARYFPHLFIAITFTHCAYFMGFIYGYFKKDTV